MDFKDKKNQANKLDYNETNTEMLAFYTFNAGLLSFFRAIDNQVKVVLNNENISSKIVKSVQDQVNEQKEMINKLKYEINMFDVGKLSEAYKDKISKTIDYIKTIMEIDEVEIAANQFFTLLQDNEMAFVAEQEQKTEAERIDEAERKAQEERKRKEQEQREFNYNIEMIFVKGSNDISDFYIGKYQVTQELWQAVMGSNPSRCKGERNLPVEMVSWNDAQKFLSKLNSITGKSYRLPSEREWEYAAKEGNRQSNYEYAGSNNINEVAWFEDNSGGRTQPVGTKKPNNLNIYDMSGNVWEWCSDYYDNRSYRVFRGGGWSSDAEYCRVSYRAYNYPDLSYYDLGLRLACSSK